MTETSMLKNFMRQINTQGRAKETIKSLEQSLVKSEESIGKPLEEITFDELLTHIELLKETLSNNSVSLRISKFIQFYKYCFDETDDIKYNKMLKRIKRINPGIKRNHINPQDILLPEDIKRLINVATLERDRCIIATLFESGIRRGELLSLTNDMVSMDEIKQEVIFNIPDEEGCKTGGRTVVCLEIYGYVLDWMKCNTSNMFMPLKESWLGELLKNLFIKAGIKKPHNIHWFRHSAITHAVNIGMQHSSISMRFWGGVDSNMLSTYIHLSEQMQANAYRNAKGMNGDEAKVINPLASRCINCGKLIQSGNLCVQCKENADLKLKVLQQENKMQDMDKKLEFVTKLAKQHFEKIVDNTLTS